MAMNPRLIFAGAFVFLFALSGCDASRPSQSDDSDPNAAPAKYQTKKLFVELGVDEASEGGKLAIKGTAKGLPDGSESFVSIKTAVAGVEVGGGFDITVKDGRFEHVSVCDFDQSSVFPSGDYEIKLTFYNANQPTAIQAAFGESGANLEGPQVEKKGGWKRVVLQKNVIIQSPEGDQKKRIIAEALETRCNTIVSLYRKLQEFKSSQDFALRGLSSEIYLAWEKRVRSVMAQDNSQTGDYGNLVGTQLLSLAASYQQSNGGESARTEDDKQEIVRSFHTMAPNGQKLE